MKYKGALPNYCLFSYTNLFKKGRDVTVYRRADGKMPCACDEEDHARFNYQKLYSMSRAAVHPALDDPGYDDLDFQISAPPRPPSNPVDPSSNVQTATAPTSNSPNAPDPPKLSGSVAADTRGPTSPQEPHSSLPVPIIVPPGLSPGAESTSLAANAPVFPQQSDPGTMQHLNRPEGPSTGSPSFPGSPRPSLQPVLGFNLVNAPVAPWSPSIAPLPSPQSSSAPLTSSLAFNSRQVDPEDVMAVDVDLSATNAEMSTNSPAASVVDFPMADARDSNTGAGDSMEVDQGTDVQNENESEEEQDGNGTYNSQCI